MAATVTPGTPTRCIAAGSASVASLPSRPVCGPSMAATNESGPGCDVPAIETTYRARGRRQSGAYESPVFTSLVNQSLSRTGGSVARMGKRRRSFVGLTPFDDRVRPLAPCTQDEAYRAPAIPAGPPYNVLSTGVPMRMSTRLFTTALMSAVNRARVGQRTTSADRACRAAPSSPPIALLLCGLRKSAWTFRCVICERGFRRK